MGSEKEPPRPGAAAVLRNDLKSENPGYPSGATTAAQGFPGYLLQWPVDAWRRELARRIFQDYDEVARFDTRARCWFRLRDSMWLPAPGFIIEIQDICRAAAQEAALAGCRRLQRSLGSYTTTVVVERKLRARMQWPWPVPAR
jgi:hypothetical protein